MKFTVNCTDLKKAADKVMSVIPKKATICFMECIEITAENNSIVLHTTNAEQFAEVRVDATVIEPGGDVYPQRQYEKGIRFIRVGYY